ncbi:signal peptidase II [Bifidobacterium sp. ESL0690]|uniref:signal peptidase II n=1 Tax=Bifidobacterium sp. ESL0690 TaxID=2983214 RepID=UPI0023F7342A|nr:signal peptidase II [Bifidobacterium sp. ESL0690]WEV46239.1 signal peptidase II [Bifidobacterium sp. ESL0690]
MKNVSPKRPRTRVAVFVIVAVVALLLDRLTKLWAQAALGDGKTVIVIPRFLGLTLIHNPGASLGMGSSVTWLISCLALVACVALVYLALTTVSLWWTAALTIAFAGAFGNLIDRVIFAHGFLNGKVVDFLNYGWSVGNVADIELGIAAVLIIILLLVNVPFSAKDVKDGDDSGDAHNPNDSQERKNIQEEPVKAVEDRGADGR